MTQIKETKKAVIYARYSSDHQREESIEGQIRECKAFAVTKGIVITGTYIDRALSAKTDNRPEFLQMIRDSAKKEFDFVIVYQLDRFSRSRYDSAVYKAKLKKNGVKVLSAKENISDEPTGIVLESLLEGMAEYYSAELSQKVLRGMTENAMKGMSTGGALPFGYKRTDGHIVVDEAAVPGVKMMFEMFINRHTINAIQKQLQALGYRNSRGKVISSGAITRAIQNEKYIGVLKWHNIRIENCHPAIIDKETFDAAQRIAKDAYTPHSSKSEIYSLTSKLVCGKCGTSYVGTSGTSKQGIRHHYYTCYNRLTKSRKKFNRNCDSRNLRADQLEEAVIKATVQMMSDEKILDKITEYAMKAIHNPKIDNRLAALEQQIKEQEKRRDNGIQALLSGINSPALKDQINQLEREISDLNKALAREKTLSNPLNLTPEHIRFFIEKIIKGDMRTANARRKIIDNFILKIVVNEKTIDIYYTYGNKKHVEIDDSHSESDIDGPPNVKRTESSVLFFYI